jgi:NADH dehydrogenase
MAMSSVEVGQGSGNTRVPRVVIVGGGFAGINVAKGLANRPVQVTLIDRNNFHTFLPLLYQVATAGLEPSDVAYPVRTIFGRATNIRFRHGHVVGIDKEREVVELAGGDEVPFDHLVLAGGAAVQFFGVPGAAEHSLPLYTLADARKLRNHLLLELERVDSQSATQTSGLVIVVVGGGPTGVETAGAVTELLDVCMKRDRLHLDPASTQVVLIDVSARLLGAFPESAGKYALKQLEKRGVNVRLSESVVGVDDCGVTLASGERIHTRTVIWAAGVTVHGTVAHTAGLEADRSGRVLVHPDLSVVGQSNTWAVGDSAAAVDSSTAAVCPQLAPVAIQTGRHCASQILKATSGLATEPFTYHDKGIMATIGRRSAIAKLRSGLIVKGTIGWFAWLGLHLFYLIGFRNRIRVLVNWTWRYFDWPSGPRLIITDSDVE